MDEKPSYFAVIPANVRYDQELKPNEKLLYGEITCLTQKTGECWASNNYFAELYGVDKSTISRYISNLTNKGYIEVQVTRENKIIVNRCIRLASMQKNQLECAKISLPYTQKNQYPIDEKVKGNNTSINNININNKKENTKEKNQIPPSKEMVESYIQENRLNVDADRFIDYYDSKGWIVGKTKMKDWQATLRNWDRRNKPEQSEKKVELDFSKWEVK